ncbi:MAG: DUF3048 domain-containing protein [Microbacterium sp.]|jgi:hypothetical protein|uniref:DUF3048 domain-containing protein n=1 Tax=unclassified Microbacterium TaxID=2609290 RepID=UPI000DAFD63E|nr:DUF3048 domain-containing protein [Microbacterium sp.]PZU36691.1 MAG: DUF3048 domain-containing protein [Microbacterium sp.]
MIPTARRRATSSRAPRRRFVIAATSLAISLSAVLAGCAGAPVADRTSAAATPTATPSETATPTPTPEPPATALSPLRGTEVLADSITGPALTAKIDNHPAARPQVGLERADIVFEELVEGGLTRYVAAWYSDVPEQIGPVRSIRPMDPDIVSPFGGVIAYSGGQQRFVDMMVATNVHNAIHGGADDAYMFRTRTKAAPHNVLVEAQRLRAAYAGIAPPAQQFAYSARPQTASAAAYGSPAAGFDLSFSPRETRSWRWDAASTRYLRAQNGVADLDASGAQLGATNVVVVSVDIDWAYGEIPRTVMVGSGTAWIATGGKVVQATWTKPSREAPIALTNAYGMPIYLAPGNTWVELVPAGYGGAVGVV